MKGRTLLLVIVLLALTKSALGIEVEPNNDSGHANPLGTENVGQLSQGSDVDFFSIKNSVVLYTVDVKYTAEDQKIDSSHKEGVIYHKKGDRVKYTADDQIVDPVNAKEGEDKYRSEIAFAFSCDSRAATGKGGWYLGLLDSNGILQNTFQVQPSDCMVGASGSQGPYSFKFSTLSGDNKLIPDAKYYLSVVGDCHVPVYSVPQSSNPVVSVNTFVPLTPATKADIDAAKIEITKAQPFLDAAIKALNDAPFLVIGSNDSIAKASDAISTANDIANKAATDLAGGITTAVTTINAVSSTAKAVKIMSVAMSYSVQSHRLFLIADAAAQNPAVQKAVDDADVEVDSAENAVKLADADVTKANKLVSDADIAVASAPLADAAKKTADENKIAADARKFKADSAKKAAQVIQINLKAVQNDTKNSDDDATTKLGAANVALADSVKILNTTVNADIAAANAATDSGTRTNNACAESNTATYTIKDSDEKLQSSPYEKIYSAKYTLGYGAGNKLSKTEQTGSINDVDFFKVITNGDSSLNFNCQQGNGNGWRISVWDEKEKVKNYDVLPEQCSSSNTFSFQFPTDKSNYFVAVQSSCYSTPNSIIEPLNRIFDSKGFVIYCESNTTDFTVKVNLGDAKTDAKTKTFDPITIIANRPINGSIKDDLKEVFYSVDSVNSKLDMFLNFSCPNANAFTNDWKLSSYDEEQKPLLTQLINGSSCRKDSETGIYKITLPRGSSRYYLSVASACASPNDKTCQLDTSEYTISRDVAVKQTKLDTSLLKTAVTLGTDKTGQINSMTDNDVYIVESSDTPEIPLVFSCTPMAIRKTDDWQLNIYDDSNELVSSQVINGNDCGSGFKADKGGYKFKVMSNDSTRYYLSVKSTCTATDCVVDTSDYTIARDVTKTYTGVFTTTKPVTTKTANFKLTNCGSNVNATIGVKAENVNLSKKSTPINVQIGGVACQTSAPIVANPLLGTVVNPSTIFDSTLIAKDNTAIVLNDCGAAKGKITLTGTGLDLENLNPENTPDYVSIPVKVDFGDFHCTGKDIFYIQSNDTGDTSYSTTKVIDSTSTVPTVITPPVVVDPIVTALSSAKNIGTSQKNKLKSAADIQAYYVDTGTKSNANFEFSCPTSNRFANDWTLSIYDDAKKLKSTKIINGSDCGTGKDGDSGVFSFSLSKTALRTYVVITSACLDGDFKTCTVDKSQYEIKRIILPVITPTTTAPCYSNCDDLVNGANFPAFGAK